MANKNDLRRQMLRRLGLHVPAKPIVKRRTLPPTPKVEKPSEPTKVTLAKRFINWLTRPFQRRTLTT